MCSAGAPDARRILCLTKRITYVHCSTHTHAQSAQVSALASVIAVLTWVFCVQGVW